MSPKPLWPLALLAFLYWEVPRILPYAVRLARGGIICTGVLILPYLVYASLHGVPHWSHEQSIQTNIVVGLAFVGMFIAILMASICFILDAERSP
jgi:hypothetical protein